MGRRHHHKGCGSCGSNSCGGCGGCGLGGGGIQSVMAQFALAQQAALAQQYAPSTAMMPVATPFGTVDMVPSTTVSTMGYPSFGQGPLAPYTGPAQVLAQYAQMSAQAGFPVVPMAMPMGFKSRKIRKRKTREVCLRPETVITGDVVYLHIPCRVAKHFDICSLRIGRHYLIGTGGHDGVDAELYSVPGGVAIPLPGGILLPGQEVCLKVKNRDCHSHWFRASLTGAAL